MSKLALLGGRPVRVKPFKSPVVIDKNERAQVKKVLDTGRISRFMGSPSLDIEKLLAMTSGEAEHYAGQYFSFLGGDMIRKFEADFAEKFGLSYAVSVNSATSGLSAALGAAGIGPGDEVITTCLSFNATALSIFSFNSIPVFVDVDKRNCCLDPKEVEKAITKKTKAILVVHLLGNAADMDPIMKIAKKHGLAVIEDCAQAPGTRYKNRFVGTIGDMGIFSFQETKNITTGEGGMVVTDDPSFAKKLRLIRNHGESIPDDAWDDDALVNIVGMNFRMTELTAALGVAQLGKLDKNNRVRTENAACLSEMLKGIRGIAIPEIGKGVVPHIFSLLYDQSRAGVERFKVIAALKAEGIPVGSGYLRLMNENPIFLRKIAYGKDHCPWSCHLYGKNIDYNTMSFPAASELIREKFLWFYHINRPNTIADMKDVVRAFKKVFCNLGDLVDADISGKAGYKW